MKTIFDKVLAILLIVIFLPLFIVLCFMIKNKLGSPVLFKQKRPGKNEKIFTIYKFRSMTDERDSKGELLPDDKRLTSFGKKLRSLSLDELPQIFNVLKGDMSFIGPRALLIEYLPRYNPEQKKRHNVKSGITGWAQVNGRNAISWEKKFELDVWYVENQSFLLDMKIIFLTIIKIVKRSDVNQSDCATVEYFNGNKE